MACFRMIFSLFSLRRDLSMRVPVKGDWIWGPSIFIYNMLINLLWAGNYSVL